MRYWSIGFVIVAILLGFASPQQQVPELPQSTTLYAYPLGREQQSRAECLTPANAIVAENCLPGTDAWQKMNTADIQVYASQDSINVGEKLSFYVDSSAATFNLTIYRMGYYGGLGARLVHAVPNLEGTKQSACLRIDDTGLRTCSNWLVSYSFDIPMNWLSGVYTAQVEDSTGQAVNQTVFTVRQDNRKSDMLYQMSVTTFQAYNNYAGKSTYSTNSGTCDTVAVAPRAVKVSLNRPYAASLWDPNYFYHTEFPMVRWLEQQGYDVAYSTNMDTHRSGKAGAHNALLDHKVFLSVGHDEYWSQQMWDAVVAARDAGVHIGFFSANTSYWRVRFEPDPITNEPDSVMVSYKTTESGHPDPSGEPTGTWRDPEEAGVPENSLIGQMYIGYNIDLFFPLRLSSEFTSDRLFRHTGLSKMPPDTYLDVGTQIIGWEWDTTVDNGMSPQNLQVLSRTPVIGSLLQDAGNQSNSNLQPTFAEMTRYITPNGAIVFSGGSIQWVHGLGVQAPDTIPPDPYVTQIAYNIFSDMGVQPATPVTDLILDGSSNPDRPLPVDKLKKVGSTKPSQISDINLITEGKTTIVRWKTDIPTIGQVWLGNDPTRIGEYGGADLVYSTDHALLLPNLELGQTYFYKVVAVNHDWDQSISDAQSFAIPNGAFADVARNMFMPTIEQGACWVRANRSTAFVIALCGVVAAALFVARIVVVREKRILLEKDE